jgi:peptidoglycan/LPS O-acetylase OafA/YrhL
MAGIVVGTLWSIRYEFDCYILIALFGMLGWLRRGPIAIAFAALFSIYVLQRITAFELHGWDYGVKFFLFSNPNQWPRLFMFFFAGAFFYLWRNCIPRSIAIFLVALAAAIFALRYGGAEPALVLVGSYCVFFFSMSAAVTPRIMGKRVDLSYGLYNFGFPIQQFIIFYFLPRGIDPLLLFLISLPLTCVLAYLSWRFIEAPSIRWKWPAISAKTLQQSSMLPVTVNSSTARAGVHTHTIPTGTDRRRPDDALTPIHFDRE